jgi:endonuclease/exonuclease/phosphatase family metal-dependent hydrolase
MRVRIATLNVWALPGPFAERVGKRMKAIGQRLPDLELDAIAFQEVWTGDARDRLVAAGRRAGLDRIWHRHAALGGSGLLVLSRLPIEEKRFDRYDLRGYPERIDHADYYGGKGFVQLRLATEVGPLSLIDTHLHACYTRDMHNEYRPLRAGQVVELAYGLHQISDPIVTVGDFNFEERQPEYRVLTGLTGLRDAAAETGSRQETVWQGNAYRPPQHPGKRIDYVFLRDGANQAVEPRYVRRIFDEPIDLKGHPGSYSDHAGLLAVLELVPRAGTPAPPRPEAIELARQMLRKGRAQAERRQRERREWAGAGLGVAVAASAGRRVPPLTRRRLLRTSLRGLAIAALTPGLGFSLLSEVFVKDEIQAFDELEQRLAQLDPSAGALERGSLA